MENIAYIDETGIDAHLFREHGYAPKGQKIYDKISGRKYKRFDIAEAKIGDKFVVPMELMGLWTVFYLKHGCKMFLPVIKKGTANVMNNASFYRKNSLFVPLKKRDAFS